ncbi:MAG: restriction endonuclease subunit S [Candidatus Pacebacteria bacterium]|nr:restriction endonuclease subunit S [Candidatus Paceibacterota bacterium]
MNLSASQFEIGSLPKGWASARLDDISDIVRGISFPKDAKTKTYQKGHIACLRTTNVQREVEWSDLWFVPKEFVRRDQQLLQKHDILISTANSLELVGKVCQVQILPHPATLGAFIAAIRISPLVNPKFFYFQIASSDIQASIRACASTTTNISNVNTNRLKEIQLVTSPLNEQRRIVAKIEELFTRLDAGVEALEKIKRELKRYRQAVLKYAFEGKLTEQWRKENKEKIEPASELLERIAKEREKTAEGKAKKLPTLNKSELPELPEGWEWARIEDCAVLITKGESPKWQGFNYVQEGVPFIRSENVLWGTLDICGVANIPEAFHNKLARSHIKPFDVLVNLVGASIGRCCVVPSTVARANLNQAVGLIRLNEVLLPGFLMHLLISPAIQKAIHSSKVETARPNISLTDLRNLLIPVASLLEQRQIVSEIERHFSITDEVEQIADKALKQSQRLRRSILKRAFEGKLVPQDPNDEPAEKLLERIKIERDKRNRKIFLYPENWLKPESRNDKSNSFKDLEDESAEKPKERIKVTKKKAINKNKKRKVNRRR